MKTIVAFFLVTLSLDMAFAISSTADHCLRLGEQARKFGYSREAQDQTRLTCFTEKSSILSSEDCHVIASAMYFPSSRNYVLQFCGFGGGRGSSEPSWPRPPGSR